jgi:hypothetical protein
MNDRHRLSAIRFAFGVGFNNFATGRGTMEELTRRAKRSLRDVESLTWYGATGNFAIHSGLSDGCLAETLHRGFKRRFAIVSRAEIDQVVSTCDAWQRPPHPLMTRWTPGVAFRVDGRSPSVQLRRTERARFRFVSDHAVAVLKLDIETAAGQLDPARRQGGWGAISADIARQVGGQGVWTARSLRAVLGLRAKADSYS